MKILTLVGIIPNLISLSRIFLIPLFLYLLAQPSVEAKLWALVVFAIASLTDLLDGWSARKLGQETELGKFLDPFADKVLVAATLVAFVFLDQLIPFWMVAIIVGRDILLTFMRYLAIKRGKSLRTSRFGKVKTAFQMVSIIIIIMIFTVRKKVADLGGQGILDITVSDIDEKWLVIGPYWIMFIVTVLTVISGIRYIMTNKELFIPGKKNNDEN